MTELEDFRATLSSNVADWLVLADWLDDRGDERARWVRYVAEHNDRHDYETPALFLRANLANFRFGNRVLISLQRRARRRWGDAVLLLAITYAEWESYRNGLCDEPKALVSLIESGFGLGQMSARLNRPVDTIVGQWDRVENEFEERLSIHAARFEYTRE